MASALLSDQYIYPMSVSSNVHFLHWLSNKPSNKPSRKHGAPDHFCDLVFHDHLTGVSSNCSCAFMLKTSVWISMCGTWVWTWLFWILVNFWCATDVLLHPLWTFHKLHFINESSDLSPTAWSMCLEDLIESPVVCVTDQTHTYRHTIFCQSL